MEQPTDHEPTEQEWRELARQALKEKDLGKIFELAKGIVEKYDDEKRRMVAAEAAEDGPVTQADGQA